ncbi:recombination protein NinB [Ralstonia thomasii]|jgi:hypothetical protein|uniref:Recombinase n=2 Tax=Ralstonia TaxID=48736 RepID=A0ABN9JC80_9RALS|nr:MULTISPECIES: recombination protein NinB [Ralstonia]MBT2177773.1 recombination protein NinB [Ralstonia pickettii]CAJ0710663.1 hypothetical protein LMG7143_01673 [Ralstonia sp. LMG 18095]CAJ0806373.1 hypothetical protein LMG18095_04432 [Ralstonia sp. LMG 18095]
MSALYKEFTLRSPGIWPTVLAFIKANAQACLERGHPLRIIVTAEERRRTSEANKFYWGVVLRDISEQAWVQGRQFDTSTWHAYFAELYGEKVEITLPDGRIHVTRRSTSDMSVGDFSEYLAKVQAHAANEFGVTYDGEVYA